MTIAFNPYVQTNAAGSFYIESDGLIVGTAMPDPAARYALSGGWLATTETLPMWGGVAISENVPQEPPSHPVVALGSIIARATAYANLTGFSVYDQNYAAVNTPQSPVPCTDLGGQVNFYRFGSGARVALEIDPTLVSLEGGLVTAQVSWDFANQKIIAFSTTAVPLKILGIKVGGCYTATRSGTTGFVTWNRNAAAAVCLL
jgi:hypothetical protein